MPALTRPVNYFEINTPSIKLSICDFYDPLKHTEISIKRARKAYPPDENTINISTNQLAFGPDHFDYSIAILSAHEIRDPGGVSNFKRVARITKAEGHIFVTEHLRDWPNFLAYTIGFFHFHSKASWKRTFKEANLKIIEKKVHAFYIHIYIKTKWKYTLKLLVFYLCHWPWFIQYFHDTLTGKQS